MAATRDEQPTLARQFEQTSHKLIPHILSSRIGLQDLIYRVHQYVCSSRPISEYAYERDEFFQQLPCDGGLAKQFQTFVAYEWKQQPMRCEQLPQN